jgi:UDP-GlcNAc3NAcA epimerase
VTGRARKRRIATIVGARPQFVKAAAVSRALANRDDAEEMLIHTGQHFDDAMSSIFFRELDIPDPFVNLGIAGGRHGAMTGDMLKAIEAVFVELEPDLIMVYGDTNSTLAGALAAAKLHIPVAHVEAGLRSFNRRMPEEVNRVLTDHVSTMLFCPTQHAIANLAAEGITSGVSHTGDVMFDATLFAKARAQDMSNIVDRLALTERAYAICTIHRAENTDDEESLRKVCDFLAEAAQSEMIVFPVHPRTRQAITRYGITLPNVTMIDPLGYFDLHRLLASAARVFTDSGGLQKEAYFHGLPCVTLRSETEWLETIESGWNRLWTSSETQSSRHQITDYGTGDSAGRIVDLLMGQIEQ